jgi:hypothetical protein
METIKVNRDALREKLVKIYSNYIVGETKAKAIENAKKLDGLWSGSFLLGEELETAINNLTSLYTKPLLSKEKAKKILKRLFKNDSKNES